MSSSAVMVIPAELKQRGALGLNATVQWPSLSRALCAAKYGSLGKAVSWRAWTVTGVGYEGTPAGGDLVVHVR
jgi:hypothetical protein